MKAKLKVIKNWEFEEFELTGTSFKYSPTGCKGIVPAARPLLYQLFFHSSYKNVRSAEPVSSAPL